MEEELRGRIDQLEKRQTQDDAVINVINRFHTTTRLLSVSVSEPDPDSIRSVDPDSESGSGSRRAKMTHKNRKKSYESSCFDVLDDLFLRAWTSFMEA